MPRQISYLIGMNTEKIAKYYTTTTSKIKAVDVLEMVKQGMSIEEIEEKLYTQVRYVVLKTK